MASQIEIVSGDRRSVEYVVQRYLPSINAVLLDPSNVRVRSKPVQIARSVTQGETILTMGFSSNLVEENLLLVTQGTVAAVGLWGSRSTGIEYIVTEIESGPGGSGGPVINLEGEVIGFIDFGGGDEDNFTYAVSIVGESW